MSALSSSQINQSYQGLLKLDDSTTGITSSIQSVQDGLGNDTGVKIATNRFEGSNIFNIMKPSTPPQYFGSGIASAAANPGVGSQNALTTQLFYDNGLYSYSAITVNCQTLEAGTSIDIAFYNVQFNDTYGYVPYQKMVTEVNFVTTSTGLKTATFATPLSFSATGPGFYYAVLRYNTPGLPVVRLSQAGSNTQAYNANLLTNTYGFVFNTAGTAAIQPFQIASSVGVVISGQIYNTSSFPTTWTSTQLNTITTTTPASVGFLLHTIR